MDTMKDQYMYSRIANTGFVNIWCVSQGLYSFLFSSITSWKSKKMGTSRSNEPNSKYRVVYSLKIVFCESLCPLITFDPRLQSYWSAVTNFLNYMSILAKVLIHYSIYHHRMNIVAGTGLQVIPQAFFLYINSILWNFGLLLLSLINIHKIQSNRKLVEF